jgi:hypothetical protein
MKSRRPGVDVSGEVVAVGKRVSYGKTPIPIFPSSNKAKVEYAKLQ